MKRTFWTVVALVVISLPSVADDHLLSVHFIDVGLGDAVLIDYGVFEALIGGGSNDTCSEYISPYLDGFLEVMIATQIDARHIGGFDEVFSKYAVASVYTSGEVTETPSYATFAEAAAEEGSYMAQARSGDTISLGGLQLEVLCPAELVADRGENSLVLRLSFMDWEFLFTGNIDSTVEDQLIDAAVGHIDILQIARYGSNEASSARFLKALRPLACVLSVGASPDGSPEQAVLNRIGCAPSAPIVFRTDVHGTTVFSVTDEGQVTYRTSSAEDPLSYPCVPTPDPPLSENPPCDCADGDTLNCEDFPCRSAAQACFEYCLELSGLDVHGLDQDQDGIACEELPEDCP